MQNKRRDLVNDFAFCNAHAHVRGMSNEKYGYRAQLLLVSREKDTGVGWLTDACQAASQMQFKNMAAMKKEI